MNIPRYLVLGALIQAFIPSSSVGADLRPENLSRKLEVERAIQRGNQWLLSTQNEESGAWGDQIHPALTALPVTAIMGDPARDQGEPLSPKIQKAYDFLSKSQKSDGGIYGKGLAVYNTSLAMMALLAAPDKGPLERVIMDARKFLINQQSDFDAKGTPDNALDGGIGYGGTYAHSDLSNTHFALEALYYSASAMGDSSTQSQGGDLDWRAAIAFVSRCQNLTETNDQAWASDDPANRGGFVYFPGDSKAGEQILEDGKVALRSYGSMSYVGLLSLIYANIGADDPRMIAVREWLAKNFSLEENPGMGAQGKFYYYHTMAKSLRILGIEKLRLADGSQVDWRESLAAKLIDLQREDGSWVNTSGRWWENDPILVTSYTVLALEHIYAAF